MPTIRLNGNVRPRASVTARGRTAIGQWWRGAARRGRRRRAPAELDLRGIRSRLMATSKRQAAHQSMVDLATRRLEELGAALGPGASVMPEMVAPWSLLQRARIAARPQPMGCDHLAAGRTIRCRVADRHSQTYTRMEKMWFFGLQEAQVFSLVGLVAAIVLLALLRRATTSGPGRRLSATIEPA